MIAIDKRQTDAHLDTKQNYGKTKFLNKFKMNKWMDKNNDNFNKGKLDN